MAFLGLDVYFLSCNGSALLCGVFFAAALAGQSLRWVVCGFPRPWVTTPCFQLACDRISFA